MMESERKYFDLDGNQCTLSQMIQREPYWVESRFTAMEAALAEKDKIIADQAKEIERLKAEIERLMDAIRSKLHG